MFVTQIRPGQLNVRESYKCGQLLLQTAEMRGLNEFNLKKIWSEGEKGNEPSTSTGLPSDNKTATHFMIKKTKRFEYSIKVDDDEGAEQNHVKKETNGTQREGTNISSLHRLPCASPTQETTAENQENTPAKKSESNLVFLKPKVYQCYYCRKIFFHTSTYRRHMIYQLKKLYWCSICKRGFVSRSWFKKHKLFCFVL